jgi:hypothetical protein
MLRDTLPFEHAWRTAASQRTPEQVRVSLILRGPAPAVPLWVPRNRLPCSACLRLLKRARFSHYHRHIPRVEPICDACWQKRTGLWQLRSFDERLHRAVMDGKVFRWLPSFTLLTRLCVATALAPQTRRFAIVVDSLPDPATRDLLRDLYHFHKDDWFIDMHEDACLHAIMPPAAVHVVDEQTDLKDLRFDVVFDARSRA